MGRDEDVQLLKTYLRTQQRLWADLDELGPQDVGKAEVPRTSKMAERCAQLADHYGFDGNLFRELLMTDDDFGTWLKEARRIVLERIETIPKLISKLTTIQPEDRTRPMPYRQAARYLLGKDSQDAAEHLKKCVDDGTVLCEHLTRQSHVFSKRDFPKETWKQISVNST